ncbi:NADH:flavin oxidoreductase/NADH oxidase family protein [Variovorax sp. CAN2819]|uniref:NADH:flavin oxidoreductase/NADH oxidase family protein n=1 Tax=Variovorax sp. CAN15 TaxID=3046727 RepID=UPI00264856D9|nr:NADH:flavin oxidoreductase/NADH oxidase family protein [Variovorax sp. CAN15]MDN6884694.1 NADH:flavin oxidoreductase/NADH oxidase family protein [Variovorax sp. CAN15]
MKSPLFSSLTLPNGSVVPNRIAKAAMEENMAAAGQVPGPAIFGLYRAWANGGAGLLITGNVMIDGRALTGPGGVVLDAATPIEPFIEWARVARSRGAQAWMQINHPGRQVRANMGEEAWAPSAVALDLGKHSKLFASPKAMSEAEVVETIARFADTAVAAERAGFTGVEIHAAHGYLISQFLSPLTNRREDRWGGELANRARLLLEVVKSVRARVSPGFCVAVKLNSADFQRGGFSEDDARQVIGWLNGLSVDLVELSGGSYESPAMQGSTADGRTLEREAYFLEFASKLAAVAKMPLMTTGGIRSMAVAEKVIAGGVAIAGMATALALVPDLPAQWLAGRHPPSSTAPVRWKDKTMAALATMSMVKRRLWALGSGQTRPRTYSPLVSTVLILARTWRLTQRYRQWRSGKADRPPVDPAGRTA